MLLDTCDYARNAVGMPASTRCVLRARYRARRFLFSDEVVMQMGHLLRDFPNALLDNYQFALPPYLCTYLEFDIDVFLNALGAPKQADNFTRDRRLGYLIDGYHVTVLVGGDGDIAREPKHRDAVIVSPLTYTMQDHTPPPGFVPVRVEVSKDAFDDTLAARDDYILGHILGTTLNNPRSTLTLERANDLLLRFRHWVDQSTAGIVKNRRALHTIMEGAVNDMRNLMALLLWVAQPKVTQLIAQPASRAWHAGKPRAYAAHHIVRLTKNVTFRSIVRAFAPRRAPRRHEVSAFWRNFEKTAGCVHDWPVLPDEHGHWHCRRCTQWRARVKQHERGDAASGFVTKEYTT